MRRGIIGSTLTVFFVATVLFFSIYLFVPELSHSVFGVSFSEPKVLTAASLEKLTGKKFDKEVVEELNEILKDEDVQKALKEGKEITKENLSALKSFLTDIDIKEIEDIISSFAKEIKD